MKYQTKKLKRTFLMAQTKFVLICIIASIYWANSFCLKEKQDKNTKLRKGRLKTFSHGSFVKYVKNTLKIRLTVFDALQQYASPATGEI